MIKSGKYRHFKGNNYEVLDVATHSETLEQMVIYRPLYGEGKLWVRPASMWEEMVERDGKVVPRFTYLAEVCEDDLNIQHCDKACERRAKER